MKINFSTDQQEHGVTMHANESGFVFIEYNDREIFLDFTITDGELILLVSDPIGNNYVNPQWEHLGRFFLTNDFVDKKTVNTE